MAYDSELADRVQQLHGNWAALRAKRMFGGIAYLLHGNMAFAVLGEALMVRCGPQRYAQCLAQEGVREFDLTGKVMKGWVLVSVDLLENECELRAWTGIGLDYAASLPAKL